MHAGIADVKQACTAQSLADFAWEIFLAWVGAGGPPKEGWGMDALGLIGNDDSARKLTPYLRSWPGESQHLRAVAGLDVLAAIGSDTALMLLNRIAQKVRFKALQDRAREKIAQIAEARGLGVEELEDRLAPDLGLDGDGTLLLDFGPRQFRVGFDEPLKSFVRDGAKLRLADLPKPNKADDKDLSAAAVERFKTLKKDARSRCAGWKRPCAGSGAGARRSSLSAWPGIRWCAIRCSGWCGACMGARRIRWRASGSQRDLDPGLMANNPGEFAQQTLDRLIVGPADRHREVPVPASPATLDAIAISELIRDMDMLCS